MSAEETPLPTCREVVDLLPDWAEGRLEPVRQAPYQRHLDLCHPCGDLARDYQALARVARASLEVEMPAAAKERLRRFLLSRLRSG
jgi:anti-sigma factor ChrR (cupin superfamily)